MGALRNPRSTTEQCAATNTATAKSTSRTNGPSSRRSIVAFLPETVSFFLRGIDAFFRAPSQDPLAAAGRMRLGFALIVLYDRLVFWHTDLGFLYSPVDGVLTESTHARHFLWKEEPLYPSFWDTTEGYLEGVDETAIGGSSSESDEEDLEDLRDVLETLASPLALFKHSKPSTDQFFVRWLFWAGVFHALCLVWIEIRNANAGGNEGDRGSSGGRFSLLRLLGHPSLHVFGILVTMVSFRNRGINMLYDMQDLLLLLVAFYSLWLPTAPSNTLFSACSGCPMWPFRLLQIQTSCIYVGAGFAKLLDDGGQWIPGAGGESGEEDGDDAVFPGLSAMHYLVHQQDFFGGVFRPDLLYGFEGPLKIATLASLVLECTCWFLVWVPRLRVPVVVAMVVFHLGIETGMNIHTFQWTSILCWTSFLVVPEPKPEPSRGARNNTNPWETAATQKGNHNNNDPEPLEEATGREHMNTKQKTKEQRPASATTNRKGLLLLAASVLFHTLLPLAVATSVVVSTLPEYTLWHPPFWFFSLEERVSGALAFALPLDYESRTSTSDESTGESCPNENEDEHESSCSSNSNSDDEGRGDREAPGDETSARARADRFYDDVVLPGLRDLQNHHPVLVGLDRFWRFWGIQQGPWSMYAAVQDSNTRIVAKVVLKKEKQENDNDDSNGNNSKQKQDDKEEDNDEIAFYYSSPEWSGPMLSASAWERKKRYRQILFWNAVHFEPTVQHDICKRWGRAAVLASGRRDAPGGSGDHKNWQKAIDHVVLKQLTIGTPPPPVSSSFWEPVATNKGVFIDYEESLLYVYVPDWSSLPDHQGDPSSESDGNTGSEGAVERRRSERKAILDRGSSEEAHHRYNYDHGWDYDRGGVWWDGSFHRYCKARKEFSLNGYTEDCEDASADDVDDIEEEQDEDGESDGEDDGGTEEEFGDEDDEEAQENEHDGDTEEDLEEDEDDGDTEEDLEDEENDEEAQEDENDGDTEEDLEDEENDPEEDNDQDEEHD
ncbi:unnamed protein product [Pseudo-nitzschia multistriata]|uniref:HTTM domain-containing protein n=1 Tax=Pseudo-nitzschia multistriata TaxID=183589 RepID=A0A448ZDD9_9STRA|nr:unnamed protein product [Pseudo-nitzschia multistriata]